MTHSAAACPLGPEFEPFLFAPVGDDRNGLPLSVLSALARRDVDPWQEAARLTELPEATAARTLAALLGAAPDGAWTEAGGRATAARLIALLPRRASGGRSSSSGKPSGTLRAGATTERRLALPAILLLIFMACMLGAEALTASHRAPAPIGHARARSSSTVVPGAPPRGGA